MKYYIVFLHFDNDINRIDVFDNEVAWFNAINEATKEHDNTNYSETDQNGTRDWFDFKTWYEE